MQQKGKILAPTVSTSEFPACGHVTLKTCNVIMYILKGNDVKRLYTEQSC